VNKPNVERSPSASQAEQQFLFDEEEDFSFGMNERDDKLKSSVVPFQFNRLSTKSPSHAQLLTLKRGPSALMASPSRADRDSTGNPSFVVDRSSTTMDLHRKDLIWDFIDDIKDGGPLITCEINCHDFATTSLKFSLWSSVSEDLRDSVGAMKAQNDAQKLDEIMEEDMVDDEERNLTLKVAYFKLIGECYWSLNKIFRDDFHAVSII
jgi:hypothetical protein